MIRLDYKGGRFAPKIININGVVLNPSNDPIDPKEYQIASKLAEILNESGSQNYKELLETLGTELKGVSADYANYIDDGVVSQIESYYKNAKGISESSVGVPGLDIEFYKQFAQDKVKKWNEATQGISFAGRKLADVDVTGPYRDLNHFLEANYFFTDKDSIPLNKQELTQYKETVPAPTDAERQVLRAALLDANAKTGTPSAIEDFVQGYVDQNAERAFGALTADALKQTIKAYQDALKQQQMYDTLGGMGLPSIQGLKGDIKNSILADIGAGGFLGFTSKQGEKNSFSERLDKSLGIGNSVQYNWQKWFDESLARRYEEMSAIKDPKDAEVEYQLDKEFAKSFIEDYLKPRFDYSKSITEFTSYMNVGVDEQNVLQTQTASDNLREFAKNRAKVFVNSLGTTEKDFDSKFYMNPILLGFNDSKKDLYTKQRDDVNAAWEQAKNKPEAIAKDGKTWQQLALIYGVNLKDPDQFARLHYTILGKDQNFDPVGDTYTVYDLNRFIEDELTPALLTQKEETIIKSAFTEFVTAEQKAKQFTDSLDLANLSPDLQKRLKELGIDQETDPAEEIKDGLMSILRTDPAIEIREQIKQLNKDRVKPTQEILGFGYIQRKEDDKIDLDPGETALFNIFKKAGYSGSESEFYTEFFPDATEEDKTLSYMSKDGKGFATDMESLTGFSMPDFSDPFSAIGELNRMLGEDDTSSREIYRPKRSTYFDYFQDEEDAGAPSYFNMGTGSSFGSLFGSI